MACKSQSVLKYPLTGAEAAHLLIFVSLTLIHQELTVYIPWPMVKLKKKNIYIYIIRGIDIISIKLPGPENPAKHPHATYGTLNNCFNLIGSHQQCIL